MKVIEKIFGCFIYTLMVLFPMILIGMFYVYLFIRFLYETISDKIKGRKRKGNTDIYYY
jgi:hypothetical protein